MSHVPAALLLCATLLVCSAQAPRAAQADNVLHATLDNGLRVVIVPDPLAPVVTEVMNYGVGSQDTPPGFPGMAHAEEHMVFARSNKELTQDQTNTIVTLLGGSGDADTQTSVTQYYLTAPAANLSEMLHIEAARMNGALTLDSEWSDERGAISQEVSRDLSSALFRHYEKALGVLFAGTPYDHTALGTRDSFDKTTGSMLQTFFRTWYAPNNAVLVIAGDVDPAQALDQVKTIFGGIARHAVPAHRAVKLGPFSAQRIDDTSDFPVPLGGLTYRMPGYQSPDYPAARVAADVLGSQRGDLAALAYQGKALAAGFGYQPMPAAGVAFAYIASPPNADMNASLDTLAGVIANDQKNGVDASLVEAAKKREIAQAQHERNSIEGLAMDWSMAVAVEGLDSPDDMLSRLGAVTADDVNHVLRTYLVRDQAIASILTPAAGGAPSRSNNNFDIKDTFGSTVDKPVDLPPWADELATVPPIPASMLSPSDTKLPNGIRLIVQPESGSASVTLSGEIDTHPALQQLPGKEGVDHILAALFPYGTTTYDRTGFQAQLDAIAAEVNAGTSFSLEVPTAGFDRGVALLADNLLHPALPPAAFAIVARKSEGFLAGQLRSPDYLTSRALSEALLPKDDPTLRQATPDSIAALTLDDVHTYYRTVYRPDLTTIVVAGDVTPDFAKATVERYFGAWQADGNTPKLELPPVPANAASSHDVVASDRTQESVTLSEEIAVKRTDPDYDALRLGNSILGGAFYTTRFWRDLREHGGLVYNVAAGLDAGKTRSTYTVSFGADPGNVAQAVTIIRRDLKDLATTPPTDAELARAKTQLIRDLSLSEASVDAITRGLASRSVHGLPLDEPTREAQAIAALSAEQVRAAFAKWTDSTRFAEVNEGPPLP
jgi:zinc protease